VAKEKVRKEPGERKKRGSSFLAGALSISAFNKGNPKTA